MLDPVQESSLVSGGDSTDHWHSSDRVPTHATVQRLQQLLKQTTVSGSYTVVDADDIILCPTGATIVFPRARNGQEIEVVMTGTIQVIINLDGPDLIYGESSVLIEVQGTALHFKAVTGGWILI